MNTAVDIDEIDNKILHLLIKDARMTLKVIAKECNISPVSVMNRIKRLKSLGVITGATLFPQLDKIGLNIVATVGMKTGSSTEEIVKFFSEYTHLIEPATSIGEYDLCALIYTEDIASLVEKTDAARRRFGIQKIIVNLWSGKPHMNFENIDLTPLQKK